MNKEVKEFISTIENNAKRKDAERLVTIMEEESGFKAALGGKIIYFGIYHYKYESGREGDALITGFSPQKQKTSIYIMPGFSSFQKELEVLGKHKTAKCCLYINKLSDVDEIVLRKIIRSSGVEMTQKYEYRSG